MIEQLQNFSLKSFKSYSGPHEKFNKKNVIFGYNGRGKSSLAKGILNESLKKYSSNNARIFNKQYVTDNLILEDDNNRIKGVVANFGEKAVGIEREINDLKKQIVDPTKSEEGITRLIKTTREHIDNIHDSRKGNARISKKNSTLELVKVMERYQKDLADARNLNIVDEELEKVTGDDTFERRLEALRKLDVGNIDHFSRSNEWGKVLEICSTAYEKIEMPSQDLISWLNEGLHMHTEESTCKFCENPLDYHEIKRKVENYNSNELQKVINFLGTYNADLGEYILSVNDFLKKKEHVLTVLSDFGIEKRYGEIEEYKAILDNATNFIELKLSGMSRSMPIENEEIGKLEHIISNIESNVTQIKMILSKKQDEVQELVSNQDTLVKGAIALALERDSIIESNLEKIEKKRKDLDEILEGNEIINGKIEELNLSKSGVGDFANLLTEILESLGIDIEVTLDDSEKNYVLQHTKSEVALTVNDISEGEKNLLSLLFFYYELFEDDEQINFKENIDVLIMDDPISSLDGANRYYVLEIIKSLLSQSKPQIFILTHVWEDFSNLSFGKDDGEYSFFEVYKNDNGESDIREKKPHDSPYKMLFQEVYTFSQKSRNEELSHCEIYHLPNSMRKIFEEFLSFKSSKGIIPTHSSKPHIESIMNVTSNTKKQRLSQLLSICNVLSHKASYNPDEILESAKFLMNLIKQKDKRHYLAMRGAN